MALLGNGACTQSKMNIIVQIQAILLCALALVGCAQRDDATDFFTEVDKSVTLTASIAGVSSTRLSLEDNTSSSQIAVEWVEGDSFSLFDERGEYLCDFTCIEPSSGSFTNNGENLTSNWYTAIYPAVTPGTPLAECGDIDHTLTQSQNGSTAHLGEALRMSARFEYDTTSSINKVVFTHQVALMKITFKPDSYGEIPASIEFKNGQEATYTLLFEDVTESLYYTSYIMIEPCEGTDRTLTFTIAYNNGNEYRYNVDSSAAYLAGICYLAPVESLNAEIDNTYIAIDDDSTMVIENDYVEDYVEFITVTISPDQPVTWKSSDENIALVYSGIVIFCGTGEVTITASASGQSSSKSYIVESLTYLEGVAQINNEAALLKFVSLYNSDDCIDSMPSQDLLLTDDIALASTSTCRLYNTTYDGKHYHGSFDGGGYTISGLCCDLPGSEAVGLIGAAGSGATIKNLTLKAANITGGNSTGAFVGEANGEFAISNCHAIDVAISSTGGGVGGILGCAKSSAEPSAAIIAGCSVAGDSSIAGGYDVGGIAGVQPAVVVGCYNKADITAAPSSSTLCAVGGIAGQGYPSGIIAGCYNSGTITAAENCSYIGGIIGQGSDEGYLVGGCFNEGDFTLSENCIYVGGIAGSCTTSLGSECIWIDYQNDSLPALSVGDEVAGGTIVTSLAELHTSANVASLNTRLQELYNDYLTEGAIWGSLTQYNNHYLFDLDDQGQITISTWQ